MLAGLPLRAVRRGPHSLLTGRVNIVVLALESLARR